MRARRHVRRPPDLTSLFDVLFIVVFAALIRAVAAQHAAEHPAPPPPKPASRAPIAPPAVAALRQQALVQLEASLAARAPLVVRITGAASTPTAPTASEGARIVALEVADRALALDAPLLEHSPDPSVAVTYLGDRSAELRICRIAALHLGATDLARYLVIMAPASPLDDLPYALLQGLRRDVDRCQTEQRGLAVLVDAAALAPSPAASPPAASPPAATPPQGATP